MIGSNRVRFWLLAGAAALGGASVAASVTLGGEPPGARLSATPVLLAAALLQAGRLDDALEQFQRALKRAPNNGWTYFGLAQLYKARRDTKAARDAEAQLANTWFGDRALLDVSRL
ncbi:MAG: tetratricopeptide repeat protein [Xanthobacteraceae bacterium]|jgi:tetratricopeptide (TPR) repeat protein